MLKHLAQIGIVGLGTMGANLARNFASKGFSVSVYNRTVGVTEEFIKVTANPKITGTPTLENFVENLEKPRIIFLMIKPGNPVDAVINNIIPLLEPEDILIDLGNSHFKDTEKRIRALFNSKLHYFGCGISGGEKGALFGPSLMPGGPKDQWLKIKPLLEKIAAKDFQNNPCVTFIGTGGAGHYVKMVHNGIEYAIMQSMAEGYQILRDLYEMPAGQIGKIYKMFNEGKLKSFLFELAAKVLQKEDTKRVFLVDKILDQAAQKGTGNWTSVESLNESVAANTIAEAVFARVISSDKKNRIKIGNLSKNKVHAKTDDLDTFIKNLNQALYFSTIINFIQGFNLIQTAGKTHNWNIDIAEVSRIWQGGCIINADMLKTFHQILKIEKTENLLTQKTLIALLAANENGARATIETAIKNGIPVPALAAALSYFDSYRTINGNANFIQALRDAFGAHSFERTDKEGTFHVDWN
jgi:6-phosphogluconate dehydrogenase